MGNLNFQDVIRDVHDAANHRLNTSASLSGGQVTVSPVQSWPDPHTYIGLVTITGSLAAASGNVTLDPGSKTQIVGNITINSSVNNIGFATVSVSNPTLYAVVNTSAAGVGNSMVTINPRTDYFGLVSVSGNVAVSALPATPSGANFIGLVTVANTIPVTFSGNVTLSDAKTYIGLVTTTIGNNPILGSGVGDIGFATVNVSNATLFAVVNTGAAGVQNSMVTINPRTDYFGLVSVSGNVVVSSLPATPAGANFIGLVTVANTVPVTFSGNVTLSDAKTFIGLVTVGNTVTVGAHALTAGVAGIGFATVNVVNQPALVAGAAYVGLASVNIGGTLPALTASTVNIGSVSVLGGGIGINAGVNYIGSATVQVVNIARTVTGNLTLSDAKTFVGLTTTVNGAGTSFIGLVTAWNRNAGTTKTLVPLTVNFSTTSVATIAVPTNANVMYLTNVLLSSNATVRLSIKSGVTYLTGNASIGVSLNPGGGFVATGSPDSPSFIGCPSGAIVIEKNDITTSIGGSLISFQE